MTNANEQEFLNLEIGKLKDSLKGIQKVFNDKLSAIPEEHRDKIKGPHLDFNKAIRAAQTGDAETLYNLTK